MLTQVILEGPMGKMFGREWNINVNSPNEALRMIEANKPGVFGWIRSNLQRYSHYRVICEYENGVIEHLDTDSYIMQRKAKKIRFVPLLQGSGGGAFGIIAGAVLFIAGAITYYIAPGNPLGTQLMLMGAAMMIGGAVAMLSTKPNASSAASSSSGSNDSSYYFDGPANTTAQGVPVQLIYGRCLVGSHAVSARATVDQLK